MISAPWKPEEVAVLIAMWPLQLTGQEMAKLMAEKKMPRAINAIFKKARRLGLTPRESPIIRKENQPSVKKSQANLAPKPPSEFKKISPIYQDITLTAKKYDCDNGCRWPVGDPKSPDFYFCAKPRSALNYCLEHEKRAFERP